MGSAIPSTPALDFEATVFSPDPAIGDPKVALYDNGALVASEILAGADLWRTWRIRKPALPGHRYHVEGSVEGSGEDKAAFAGPIWVLERNPDRRSMEVRG
jgi:hypothetical protein